MVWIQTVGQKYPFVKVEEVWATQFCEALYLQATVTGSYLSGTSPQIIHKKILWAVIMFCFFLSIPIKSMVVRAELSWKNSDLTSKYSYLEVIKIKGCPSCCFRINNSAGVLCNCNSDTVDLQSWQSGTQWVQTPRDISGWYVRGPPTSLMINYGALWQEQFNPSGMTDNFKPNDHNPVASAHSMLKACYSG